MGADPAVPTPAEAKAIVRRGYDKISYAYRPDSYDGQVSVYADLLDWLTPLLSPRSRVLDLGCGCGLPVAQSLAAQHDVVGVDLSLVQLRRARTLVPEAAFLQADMGALSFPPATFEAVTALYAIIHLPLAEHRPLFGRIYDWLRPGGHFLATLGNQAWTGTEEAWQDVPGGTMYWSHSDADSYRRWLAECGFVWQREGCVPEGDGGHAVFLMRRPR